MEKEINDVIKKNLPAHVGEELKKRLDLCDKLEKAKEGADKELLDAKISVGLLQSELEEFKELRQERDNIITSRGVLTRDQELYDIKQERDSAILVVKELCAAERVNDIKGIVQSVFGNHLLHKSVMNTKTGHSPDNTGYMHQHTDTDSVTESEDLK